MQQNAYRSDEFKDIIRPVGEVAGTKNLPFNGVPYLPGQYGTPCGKPEWYTEGIPLEELNKQQPGCCEIEQEHLQFSFILRSFRFRYCLQEPRLNYCLQDPKYKWCLVEPIA